MKTLIFTCRILLPLVICSMIFSFQGCKKTTETKSTDEETETMGKRPEQPPPPFYFSNCSNPRFSGNFVTGSSANVTITLNYVNSPGGSYPSFTSTTVNGITIKAPSGTVNTGTGSITFTASGTPVATGYFFIPVRIGASNICNLQIVVLNPSTTVSSGDPGPVAGSIGTVNFNYQNQ